MDGTLVYFLRNTISPALLCQLFYGLTGVLFQRIGKNDFQTLL